MYRQPLPAQQNGLGHGILNFIDQFRQAQRSKKEQAKQDFYQDIQLLSQGIPVDIEKAAKKARKAGLDFDFEGPTPEIIKQQEAQQQAMAQQQQMPAPPQPGMGGNPMMNLGRRMGIVPPTGKIPQGAGIYKMLQEIQQRGQQGQEMQDLEMRMKKASQNALLAYAESPDSPQGMAALKVLQAMDPNFRSEAVLTEEFRKSHPDAYAKLQEQASKQMRAKLGPTLLNDVGAENLPIVLDYINTGEWGGFEKPEDGIDPDDIAAGFTAFADRYDLEKVPEADARMWAVAHAKGDAEAMAAISKRHSGAAYKGRSDKRAAQAASRAAQQFGWDAEKTASEKKALQKANELLNTLSPDQLAALPQKGWPKDLGVDVPEGMRVDVLRYLRSLMSGSSRDVTIRREYSFGDEEAAAVVE